MIRIISGKFKGKRLRRVPSPEVRPMQNKLRGALFNILSTRINGCAFLDGFSGTGAIGLEAISRGAALAVFIESFYPAVKIIHDNVSRCGAEDRAVIIHKDFNRAIIDLAQKELTFDFIMLDPPYVLLKERNPLKVIRKRKVLKPDGLVILRHFDKIAPLEREFQLVRRLQMGDDILSFYNWPEASL